MPGVLKTPIMHGVPKTPGNALLIIKLYFLDIVIILKLYFLDN